MNKKGVAQLWRLFAIAMLLLENEVIYGKSLLFDEKIIEFVEAEDLEKLLSKCDKIIDAKGNFVSPGFIDMHVHGSGGYDIMDGTEEALNVISSVLAQNGVTGFLPTTMTMSKEKIYASLDNVRNQMKKKRIVNYENSNVWFRSCGQCVCIIPSQRRSRDCSYRQI